MEGGKVCGVKRKGLSAIVALIGKHRQGKIEKTYRTSEVHKLYAFLQGKNAIGTKQERGRRVRDKVKRKSKNSVRDKFQDLEKAGGSKKRKGGKSKKKRKRGLFLLGEPNLEG